MASTIESQFRNVEKQLDDALSRDRAAIVARGIAISDWSARHYHYKNESLKWSYSFERRELCGSEYHKWTVRISIQEHDLATADVFRSREVFQLGMPSRVKEADTLHMPLTDLIQLGVAAIVLPAFE